MLYWVVFFCLVAPFASNKKELISGTGKNIGSVAIVGGGFSGARWLDICLYCRTEELLLL